jgi:hypothetical protein
VAAVSARTASTSARSTPCAAAAGHVLRSGNGGEHRHLLGGDHPVAAGGGDGRQLLEGPAVAHDLVRRGGREPQVPAQPGGHRLHPVVLGGLFAVGAADGARELGVDPVPRPHQQRRPVEQLRGDQVVEVVGGEGVQGRQQLAHDTSHAFDQTFEF